MIKLIKIIQFCKKKKKILPKTEQHFKKMLIEIYFKYPDS